MRLEKLGEIELTYTDVDVEFSYEEGGQVYGVLTGSLSAGELRGTIHATNLARQRPDGAFTPRLRGILTTQEGVNMFFTMDGISIKDSKASPPRRLVTTGITLWTVDSRYRRWNEVFILAEMEGRAIGTSWGVAGPIYQCKPEL